MTARVFSTAGRTLALLALILVTAGCNWIKLQSVSTAGVQSNAVSEEASLSGDGRYMVYQSGATNLLASDNTVFQDIFLRDAFSNITTRVSVDNVGVAGNGDSINPKLSDDARYIVFESEASNLVANDTNNVADIFVHDRQTSTIVRVSVDGAGAEVSLGGSSPNISADGRYVVFVSQDGSLVAGDNNGVSDVFVYDLDTGAVSRVSVDSLGAEGDEGSLLPDISDDGRYVSFLSFAGNLVSGDNNAVSDVFLHDRNSNVTTRVSVDSAGNEANSFNLTHALSGDGRYVAFESFATNLVAGVLGLGQVYLHDRNSAVTTLVSVNTAGAVANSSSTSPALSMGGRYVAFQSFGTNLVVGDTNLQSDIFVRDTLSGTTDRVSEKALGEQANGPSFAPALSGDSRYISYTSEATNLIGIDSNGALADVFIRTTQELVITYVSPQLIPIGATTSVTISGVNFLSGSRPSLGGGDKSLSNVVVVDENTITLDITIDVGADAGSRGIIVVLEGTGPGDLFGAVAFCENCVTLF